MQTKKFSSSSWHCELAVLAGHHVHHSTNICEYSRRVVLGALIALVMIVIMGGLSLLAINMTGAMIYGILASLIFWENYMSDLAILGAIIYTILGSWFTVKMISTGKWKLFPKSKDSPPKEPGFIKQAYRSYKGKYCYQVETVSDHELSLGNSD